MVVLTSLFLLLTCKYTVKADILDLDPCTKGIYIDLNTDTLGSRNEHCPMASAHNTVCDHYLKDNWYAVKDALMLNHCPQTGDCGVLYPIWMQGTHPSPTDGIVDRTACIRKSGNCCAETINIEMKNCTNFLVYHLHPLSTCPTAYCFDSTLPCVILSTPVATTTGVNDVEEPCWPCKSDWVWIIIVTVIVSVVLFMTVLIVCMVILKKKMVSPTEY